MYYVKSLSGIYCMLMTGVIHSVFTLVNWLPDNVLRWIGGSLGAHGVADMAAESSERGFRGAVAAVSFKPGGKPAPKPTNAPTAGDSSSGAGSAKRNKDSAQGEHFGG